MSRLRNRMTKAEFWTDPDLLSWHRDKRHFYQGLRSAAEDSGCIEDSPFGWMLVLYPSPLDRDISLEQVGAWRNELIADGKLIRYRCAGKDYLYQTTFHDHEHPRNPQAPNLPLPPWVKWIGNASDSRKGRYEVDAAAAEALLKARTTLVQGVLGDDPSEGADLQELPCTTIEQGLYNACTSVPVLPCPALSSPDQPSSNGGQPVDNFADQQRGCSIEHEEHEPEPPGSANGDGAAASHAATGDNVGTLRHSPTCEDRACAVRTLRCGLRGTIAQIVGPAEAGNLYNESTALHKSLAGMAGYICAATWKASNAATMEQRHPLCRKAMVAYVDALYDFHRQKPIRSLPAFLKTRYGNMTEAPVSDELLLALRKLERTGTNGKSEPVRVGTTLPPIERVEEEAS